MFLPNGDPGERQEFAEFQREAATPEMAAELLQLVYAADVGDLVGDLGMPVQVLHRRGDRAVPFRLGRELAAAIPGARFVPLEGSDHMPWQGEVAQVVAAVRAFLRDEKRPSAPEGAEDGPLSEREVEILRMVARGLSDRQIAEALVLSPHTVHRHVANIRTKLRQPTRTAAATEAARLQLI
jgi:DNA-binding CsgD family transcriptional regulator